MGSYSLNITFFIHLVVINPISLPYFYFIQAVKIAVNLAINKIILMKEKNE